MKQSKKYVKPPFDIDELELQLNKYEFIHRRAIGNWKAVKLRLQILQALQPKLVLGNASDSDEYQELEQKKPPRRWFIVDKEAKWKLAWDLVSSFLLLFSYFLTLYTLSFSVDNQVKKKAIELFLDVFQLFDIILMFVTTRKGEDGELMDVFQAIAPNYLRETFIFDAIGCLPGLIMFEDTK